MAFQSLFIQQTTAPTGLYQMQSDLNLEMRLKETQTYGTSQIKNNIVERLASAITPTREETQPAPKEEKTDETPQKSELNQVKAKVSQKLNETSLNNSATATDGLATSTARASTVKTSAPAAQTKSVYTPSAGFNAMA